MRFCVDYRKLNEIKGKDGDPLPRITEALDAVGGPMDLHSGYWRIEMDEDSRENCILYTQWLV